MPNYPLSAYKSFTTAWVSVLNFFMVAVLAQLLAGVVPRYDASSSRMHNQLNLSFVVSIIAVVAGGVAPEVSRIFVLPLPTIGSFDPKQTNAVKGTVLTAFTYFLFLGDVVKAYKPVLARPELEDAGKRFKAFLAERSLPGRNESPRK
jgi:hypothetical protein